MAERLKQKLEFPGYHIQAQAIKSLVATILKEKGANEVIGDTPHTQSLWQQCCSDSPLVRWSCCQALILLVDQGHAHLEQTLHQVLNMLPSAKNVQGLVTVVSKLLQLQLNQQDKGIPRTHMYAIRTSPHPFISVLESRLDTWPFLLQEIRQMLQHAHSSGDTACLSMLLPFLRFLYCDPMRTLDHALLRQGLIRLLLPPPRARDILASPTTDSSPTFAPETAPGAFMLSVGEGLNTEVTKKVLHCLMELLPHMQVNEITSLLELCNLLEALVNILHHHHCHEELQLLVEPLMSACYLALTLGSDITPLVALMHTLLPYCAQGVLFDQVFIGLCVLLLRAPTTQQTILLRLVACVLQMCPSPPAGGFWLLLLPLLHVTSTCDLLRALTHKHTLNANLELVQKMLQTLEEMDKSNIYSKESADNKNCAVRSMCESESLRLGVSNPWLVELTLASHTLRGMAGNPVATTDWLHAISGSLPRTHEQTTLPDTLPLLLTHALFCHLDEVERLALDTVATLAEAHPAQVSYFLPVLMYKLSSLPNDAALSISLLHTIPKMATHKECVPQVLQVMRWLWSSPKLQCVVLRLMTSLWLKQERVYPELQRLINAVDKGAGLLSKEVQWEQALARATCIKDICKERPYQHGADMLAAITHTLSRYTHMDQATLSALMLDGLQELIKAEVVDICSTWKALSPQLCEDTRPLIIQAITRLLSHTHTLAVATQEYQNVQEQVVCLLWSYALHQNPEIAACGYKALSTFPAECHLNLHLPEKVRPEQNSEEEEEEEEVNSNKDPCVDGPSYIKLLIHTPQAVLPGLQLLLHSIIHSESVAMPRGVYHSAFWAGSAVSRSKTLTKLPAFLMKTYEKNTQPGLKSGLSAGLLCCYDTPIHMDRDGRPISRFLGSRGRGYQQTLATLIHEVSPQPSEWHFSLLLLQAWKSFMGRAFIANLEAELELLRKQEKENPEDLKYKETCAWLSVRDQLTNVIKSAVKESPNIQGNSILALAGLATAVSKYQTNMETSKHTSGVGQEFVKTADWLSMVIDTLLSIMSSSHRPKGQVFPWFSHRSNTASVLARSCAMLGLALLLPNLQRDLQDSRALAEVLTELRSVLPGQAGASESQVLALHGGLALGLLLAGIEEDRGGLVKSSAEELLATCLNPELDSSAGCVLGSGLLLSSLIGRPEQLGLDPLDFLNRMIAQLQNTNTPRAQQEVLAYSVASICIMGFTQGQVCANRAEEIMNLLRHFTEDNQQSPGFAMALGVAIHGLASSGHGKAEYMKPCLLDAWTKILLAEGCSTLMRLASLQGLAALVGSEHTLLQLKCELSSVEQGRLNDVIKTITQVLSCSAAIGLQSKAACLLAYLHLAHLTSGNAHATVPQDYRYLPEKSLIRASVDFLLESGKKGLEFATPEQVKTALSPLASAGTKHQFPPINWSTLLNPLMRLHFGEEVQHHCLELAANQVSTSHSASLFLTQWLTPPLVHSLSVRTRALLYKCMGVWMNHVPTDCFQSFLNIAIDLNLRSSQGTSPALIHALLEGLVIAMGKPNPTQGVWAQIKNTTETVYTLLPNQILDADMELFVGVAKCLSELNDTDIDTVAKVTETTIEKAAFILAYLTSLGRLPLYSLNDVISASLRSSVNKDTVSHLLFSAFYQSRFANGPHAGVSVRVEWLLELMGHIRNVAYSSTTVPCESVPQATDFLFGVLSGAVVSWADMATPLLVGLHAHWTPCLQNKCTEEMKEVGSTAIQMPLGSQKEVMRLCQHALPFAIPRLLEREPWRSQTQKVLDWLCSVAEAPSDGVSQQTVCCAKAALLGLKASPEFKKKSVWTRAYGW